MTLETDVTDYEKADRILLALSDSVCSRMRADGVKAQCVAVTIRGNDFKNRSHQRKLQEPTDITSEVFALCKALFREVWDHRTPLRLLGVSLTELGNDGYFQQSLFPDQRREKNEKLDNAVASIRHKFGSGTIQLGGTMKTAENVGKKHKAQMDLKNQNKQ